MRSCLRVFLALFFIAAVATACGEDSPPPVADDGKPTIVGKWEIVEAEGAMAGSNKGQVYTFNADGTMDISGITRGTYSFDGKTVQLKIGTIEMAADIEFRDAKTMVYTLQNSNQVFTMNRK